MSSIAINKVQMALTRVRNEGMTIPAPGAIDGAWGPTTERSLDAYLSSVTPPFHGEIEVDLESGTISTDGAVVAGLAALAREYHAERVTSAASSPATSSGARRARPDAAGPITTIDATPARWGLWFGAVLALVGIGGAIWYLTQRKKGWF